MYRKINSATYFAQPIFHMPLLSIGIGVIRIHKIASREDDTAASIVLNQFPDNMYAWILLCSYLYSVFMSQSCVISSKQSPSYLLSTIGSHCYPTYVGVKIALSYY